MNFNKWIDVFLYEKGIDVEQMIKIEKDNTIHFFDLRIIINSIKSTTKFEQATIKNTLITIDFKNGDVIHYFKYLAQALI